MDLIIPGTLEVFAAPAGVVHYISEHSYRPPPAFLEAVMNCPDCGSEPYWQALRRANGGQEPPMVNHEEYFRSRREIEESSNRFRRAVGVPLKQATKAQILAAARLVWPEISFSDDYEVIDDDGEHVIFYDQGCVLKVS